MKNKAFLQRYHRIVPFVILWVLSIWFFQYPKGEVVLILNRIHSPILDFVFTKFSSIGNALSVFVFIGVVFWKYDLKYLRFFVLAFLLESLVVILSKRLLFAHIDRPFLFFQNQGILEQLNFVEGVKISKRKAFPSGHTAYSFCMALFFAIRINHKLVSIGLAILAAFVAVARMYLVQHFFVDVFAGAFVGISMTCLAYFIVFGVQKKKASKQVFSNLLQE